LTLQDLGSIGELLGAIGVILSLVYLAVQIRQNTNALRASSNHSLNDAFSGFLTLLVENERASDILSRGAENLESLDAKDCDTFYSLLGLLFNHFENCHLHYRKGLLDPDQWARWRIAIGWYAGLPGVSVWWQNRGGIFSPQFREFVSEERRSRGATDFAEWSPGEALQQLRRG
jgi:hypothetical protein